MGLDSVNTKDIRQAELKLGRNLEPSWGKGVIF